MRREVREGIQSETEEIGSETTGRQFREPNGSEELDKMGGEARDGGEEALEDAPTQEVYTTVDTGDYMIYRNNREKGGR